MADQQDRQPGADLHPDQLDLHICRDCASDLVHPLDWVEYGDWHWTVTLYCPDCDQTRSGVFEQVAVELFDEQLDRGTHTMLALVQALETERLQRDADRFVAALNAGYVMPEDF